MAANPQGRGRPPQFDRVAVLEAAAELLAEVGEGGFTARGLSERAQVPVATIYRHLGDRQQILIAVLDDLGDRLEIAELPTGDAVTVAAAAFGVMFDALAPHPWVAPLLHGAQFGRRGLVYAEAFFGALKALGVDDHVAVYTYRQSWWLTRGALLQLATSETDDTAAHQRLNQLARQKQFGHLTDMPRLPYRPTRSLVEQGVRALVTAQLSGTAETP